MREEHISVGSFDGEAVFSKYLCKYIEVGEFCGYISVTKRILVGSLSQILLARLFIEDIMSFVGLATSESIKGREGICT